MHPEKIALRKIVHGTELIQIELGQIPWKNVQGYLRQKLKNSKKINKKRLNEIQKSRACVFVVSTIANKSIKRQTNKIWMI